MAGGQLESNQRCVTATSSHQILPTSQLHSTQLSAKVTVHSAKLHSTQCKNHNIQCKTAQYRVQNSTVHGAKVTVHNLQSKTPVAHVKIQKTYHTMCTVYTVQYMSYSARRAHLRVHTSVPGSLVLNPNPVQPFQKVLLC